MGFLDIFRKGVDVSSQDENQEVEQRKVLSDEEIRRKEAMQRLINGENLKNNENAMPNAMQEEKRTVQIYVIKTNDDIAEVITMLKRGEPAIVNLTKISKQQIQRTQDFLSGVVFALNAHISEFATNIYLLTPNGVRIEN